MGTCHCSRCRKVGSSIFVIAKKESFNLIKGADMISTYQPEPGFKYFRNFCKNCGTALGEILSNESTFLVSANCFDNDPIVRNKFHEFVSNKPTWYSICDSAEQFSEHPIKNE
ncbi:GFA family protein [bacterium]|nr:GFA family protein [bacterium]